MVRDVLLLVVEQSGGSSECLFTFKQGLLASAENTNNAFSGMLNMKPSNEAIDYDVIKRAIIANDDILDFHEAELKRQCSQLRANPLEDRA